MGLGRFETVGDREPVEIHALVDLTNDVKAKACIEERLGHAQRERNQPPVEQRGIVERRPTNVCHELKFPISELRGEEHEVVLLEQVCEVETQEEAVGRVVGAPAFEFVAPAVPAHVVVLEPVFVAERNETDNVGTCKLCSQSPDSGYRTVQERESWWRLPTHSHSVW